VNTVKLETVFLEVSVFSGTLISIKQQCNK